MRSRLQKTNSLGGKPFEPPVIAQQDGFFVVQETIISKSPNRSNSTPPEQPSLDEIFRETRPLRALHPPPCWSTPHEITYPYQQAANGFRR